VDEQASRLSRLFRRVAASDEAWRQWYWLWDAYYTVGLVALLTMVLTDDTRSTVSHVGSAVTLGIGAVWYVFAGRPVIIADRHDWRTTVFMIGMIAVYLTALAFDGTNSFGLFAVIPMAFMTLRLRSAILLVVPLNLTPPLSAVLHGAATSLLAQLVPFAVGGMALSVLLGVWITRVISESEERKELISQLEATRAEVSRLSHETGVAAERSRLAAEIHDTLAQGFTSLLTLVQAAESELDNDRDRVRDYLTLAARTARENLDEARALVVGLTSLSHGTGSLDEAVRRQVDRLVETTGISTDYRVAGDLLEVPTAAEVLVLRTVQETMTNVGKHATADHVTVSLRFTGSAVVLEITDDGVGFDADAVRAAEPAGPTGFGLRGMRSRAEQVGGELEISSAPGDGTTVRLEVPL